jgi:hypothetical protein
MRSQTLIALAVLALVPSTALADNNTKPANAAKDVEASPEQKDAYVEPHFVPYRGGRIPDYAHIETKPNVGLIATGIATFGTAYLGAFLYALGTCSAQMECRPGSNWLYLPIAGPFIAAATAPTTGGAALAAFDGGVQVLGATLAIAGFLAPKKFVMWQDKAAKLELVPTGAGVGLTLTHL